MKELPQEDFEAGAMKAEKRDQGAQSLLIDENWRRLHRPIALMKGVCQDAPGVGAHLRLLDAEARWFHRRIRNLVTDRIQDGPLEARAQFQLIDA